MSNRVVHFEIMGRQGPELPAFYRSLFGWPVDVIGVSTGCSIVQHLAADHPDVVRRLVIHSSAYPLSPAARPRFVSSTRSASVSGTQLSEISIVSKPSATASSKNRSTQPRFFTLSTRRPACAGSSWKMRVCVTSLLVRAGLAV